MWVIPIKVARLITYLTLIGYLDTLISMDLTGAGAEPDTRQFTTGDSNTNLIPDFLGWVSIIVNPSPMMTSYERWVIHSFRLGSRQ